jgi:AFG3 family protein
MMVANLGLNSELGNISYFDSSGSYETAFQKPFSEDTSRLIDQEVRKLIEEAHDRTRDLLTTKRSQLDALAHLLLEKEIVYKEDIERILGKRVTAD